MTTPPRRGRPTSRPPGPASACSAPTTSSGSSSSLRVWSLTARIQATASAPSARSSSAGDRSRWPTSKIGCAPRCSAGGASTSHPFLDHSLHRHGRAPSFWARDAERAFEIWRPPSPAPRPLTPPIPRGRARRGGRARVSSWISRPPLRRAPWRLARFLGNNLQDGSKPWPRRRESRPCRRQSLGPCQESLGGSVIGARTRAQLAEALARSKFASPRTRSNRCRLRSPGTGRRNTLRRAPDERFGQRKIVHSPDRIGGNPGYGRRRTRLIG